MKKQVLFFLFAILLLNFITNTTFVLANSTKNPKEQGEEEYQDNSGKNEFKNKEKYLTQPKEDQQEKSEKEMILPKETVQENAQTETQSLSKSEPIVVQTQKETSDTNLAQANKLTTNNDDPMTAKQGFGVICFLVVFVLLLVVIFVFT